MAEQIVSPGVFTRENDQSFITQQPVEVGAAIIGPAVKGPVEIPTVVTSYSEFKNKFGSTFVSGGQTYSFLTSISAYNYFQNGGNTLLVTRVASGSWTPASSSGIYNDAGGTLITTADALLESISTQPSASAGTYTDVESDSVVGTGTDVTASIILDTDTNVSTITITGQTGTFSIGDVITFHSSSLGATDGDGTDLVITVVADDIVASNSNTPFVLKTISEGTIMNSEGPENADGSLDSGSVDNVRWEITNSNTGSGTFTINIRRGNDVTNEKVI